jgi:hypothetical protein
MKLIYMAILLLSLPVLAEQPAELVGDWKCSVAIEGEDKQEIESTTNLTFELNIDKNKTRFIRKGLIKMKTGIPQIPVMAIQTVEEGTILLTGKEIRLTPMKVDLNVVEGKEIVTEDVQKTIKEELLKDEIGMITKSSSTELSIHIKEQRQTNTCSRIGKALK